MITLNSANEKIFPMIISSAMIILCFYGNKIRLRYWWCDSVRSPSVLSNLSLTSVDCQLGLRKGFPCQNSTIVPPPPISTSVCLIGMAHEWCLCIWVLLGKKWFSSFFQFHLITVPLHGKESFALTVHLFPTNNKLGAVDNVLQWVVQ